MWLYCCWDGFDKNTEIRVMFPAEAVDYTTYHRDTIHDAPCMSWYGARTNVPSWHIGRSFPFQTFWTNLSFIGLYRVITLLNSYYYQTLIFLKITGYWRKCMYLFTWYPNFVVGWATYSYLALLITNLQIYYYKYIFLENEQIVIMSILTYLTILRFYSN